MSIIRDDLVSHGIIEHPGAEGWLTSYRALPQGSVKGATRGPQEPHRLVQKLKSLRTLKKERVFSCTKSTKSSSE